METVRILCIGDVVGAPGRAMVQKHLPKIKESHNIDFVIVNGENSAGGKGITTRIAQSFKHMGVDVITTGNHIWQKKDIYGYLSEHNDVLRPANFPPAAPGVGMTTVSHAGFTLGVINLQGRVFMREHVDCPFRAANSLLTYLSSKTKLIIVDFHAEATAEKQGIAYCLDGKVTAVVGTHTHVQTADERVLPQGTAFISDLGMVGAQNSMLGMKKEPIIQSMITQMPAKFVVELQPPIMLNGVVIEANARTGAAISIKRIQIFDDELMATPSEDDK